jgi:hypothetical protein
MGLASQSDGTCGAGDVHQGHDWIVIESLKAVAAKCPPPLSYAANYVKQSWCVENFHELPQIACIEFGVGHSAWRQGRSDWAATSSP